MTLTERKFNGRKPAAGTSPLPEHARRTLIRIAESDFPVLLVGERGVGKRTTAMEIHAQSGRSRQPFREFSCPELDSHAIQSISEGNGTVYMAEVGGLSLALQDHLTEAYFRSGEAQNCRLLFGSSRELLADVKTLHMREEFFYLISAITLRISPLRLRKREILGIADGLLAHYSERFDRPKPALSQEAIDFLIDHNWPDNIPELETAIKTFVAIGDQTISLAALQAAALSTRSNGHRENRSLKEAIRKASAEVERQLISQVLGSNGGNRKRTASELGISYKTLLYKIKQVGLEDTNTHSRFGVTV
jgi:two-component system response regulator AtoC